MPIRKLIAKLPPPQTDPSTLGWLKRYGITWLVPSLFSAYAIYLVAGYFFAPFIGDAGQSQVLKTMLDSITKSFNTSNSTFFLSIYDVVLLCSLVAIAHRYLQLCKQPWFVKRRAFYIVEPWAYWLQFVAVKMISIIVTPLALVLAAAHAIDDYALECLVLRMGLALAVVVAALYALMHHGLHAPFIYTVNVIRHGSNAECPATPAQTEQWLEEHQEAIAAVFGSIWVSNTFVLQDGKWALMLVGLPQHLDNYPQHTRDAFKQLQSDQKELWNGRKFSFDDAVQKARRDKKKTH